jgi:uncharacterized membrane protein YeiH
VLTAASSPTPFFVLELLGTIAFAVSGGAVAVRAGMDWLGVVVLAVVTAVGGGTIRDLLIGTAPVRWVNQPWPIVAAVATAAVIIVLAHRRPGSTPDTRRAVLVADAAGLAAFTVTGTLICLDAGVPGWVAGVLGVVTGAGGGVLRDVLARERPMVLVSEIYAVAALVGAAVAVVLTEQSVEPVVVRWVSVAVVLAIRLVAVRRQWTLPRFDGTAGP